MKKGKSNKKFMAILVAAIAVALVGMTIVSNSMGKKEIIPTVTTVKAQKGDLEERLDTSGTVVSQNKKTFFSPVNGTIKVLEMEQGDSVKSGKKLITFDIEELEKENQKAELNIRSGNLDIQDAVNSANTAAGKQAAAAAKVGPLKQQVEAKQEYITDLKAKITKRTSEAQKKAVKQAEDAAKKAAAEAKKQQEAALKQYQKEMDTYNNKILPEYNKKLAQKLTDVNTATANYNTADSQYQQAFQKWSANQDDSALKGELDKMDSARSKAQADVRATEEAYQAMLNSPPSPPQEPGNSGFTADTGGNTQEAGNASQATADTSDLEAELEKASSDLAELQADLSQQKAIAESDVTGLSAEALEKMNISTNLAELEAKSLEELIAEGKKGVSAEFTGVVSDCRVTEGATVTQGMELFTLQSTEDVSVEISVSKNDYDKVKEGQKAEITMGSSKYSGTVTKVDKIAIPNEKGTPVIGAKVHIDNPDENIFLSVEAKVSILAAQTRDTLRVPIDAVNIGNDGSFCYVVEDGVIAKKIVETGISSQDYTEIKSGLEEGAELLTDIGTYGEGDKVTAVPQSEDAQAESAAAVQE